MLRRTQLTVTYSIHTLAGNGSNVYKPGELLLLLQMT